MKQFTLFVLGALYWCSEAYTQSTVRPLDINDRVPNSIMRVIDGAVIRRGPEKTNRQWTILSFWNRTCGSCIVKFPEEQRLQEKFKDVLNILLVTRDRKSVIDETMKKIKKSLPELPALFSDSILSRAFPHLGVPHVVWIDEQQVVRYVTYGDALNETNLKTALSGRKVDARMKKDDFEFDKMAPLLSNPAINDRVLYTAVFSKNVNGVGSQTGASFSSDKASLRLINATIADFLSIAATGKSNSDFVDSHIELRVADKRPFSQPPLGSNDSAYAKTFCYELVVPIENKTLLMTMFKQDVERFFPYSATIDSSRGKHPYLIITDK